MIIQRSDSAFAFRDNNSLRARIANPRYRSKEYFVISARLGGGTTDWNSITEQRERPERDHLIASKSM